MRQEDGEGERKKGEQDEEEVRAAGEGEEEEELGKGYEERETGILASPSDTNSMVKDQWLTTPFDEDSRSFLAQTRPKTSQDKKKTHLQPQEDSLKPKGEKKAAT